MDVGTGLIVITSVSAYVLLVGMALTGIWESPGLDPLQKVIWTVVVAIAPALGAVVWFWLGRPRPLQVRKRT